MRWRSLGDIYDSAPYGYVLPMRATDFGAAIAGAVQDLINDGTYKTILDQVGRRRRRDHHAGRQPDSLMTDVGDLLRTGTA